MLHIGSFTLKTRCPRPEVFENAPQMRWVAIWDQTLKYSWWLIWHNLIMITILLFLAIQQVLVWDTNKDTTRTCPQKPGLVTKKSTNATIKAGHGLEWPENHSWNSGGLILSASKLLFQMEQPTNLLYLTNPTILRQFSYRSLETYPRYPKVRKWKGFSFMKR